MGRLTEIARFFDPEEALCADALLRAHGVRTLIKNEHHLNMAPSLRVALGGFQLLVVSEDKARASSILESIRNIDSAESAEPLLGHKSEQTERRRKRDWLWLPIAFMWGVPFIPPRRTGVLLGLQLVTLILLYLVILLSWGLWWEW